MNLKPFVNDKTLWGDFLLELDERISACYKAFEQAKDPSEMYRLQGEIRGLKRLKFLREKVNG